MGATITHLDGSMQAARRRHLPALLAELDDADDDHTDVSVSDESGWTVSAFANGVVIWENVEEQDRPRHLAPMPRGEVLRLFELVVAGDLAAVERHPWRPGYG